MKANNLSISIPYTECGKNCPYCISKMTGYMKADEELFRDNLVKARRVATAMGVSSLMITSKGEPFNNLSDLDAVISYFRNFPIEVQTNGLPLIKGDVIVRQDISTVAVSVDSPDYFSNNYAIFKVWENIHKSKAIARATILMSNRFKGWKLHNFLAVCKEHNIRQLTFRHATVPDNRVCTKQSREATQWIEDHYCTAHYNMIIEEIQEKVTDEKDLVLELPFGASVYDIDDISVSYFDYCVQENSNGENIRSLIYQEDGHMYLTWDKQGSIIW